MKNQSKTPSKAICRLDFKGISRSGKCTLPTGNSGPIARFVAIAEEIIARIDEEREWWESVQKLSWDLEATRGKIGDRPAFLIADKWKGKVTPPEAEPFFGDNNYTRETICITSDPVNGNVEVTPLEHITPPPTSQICPLCDDASNIVLILKKWVEVAIKKNTQFDNSRKRPKP